MDRVYPYPTRNICPWIPKYQYPLISIPDPYPNVLSMDIHTLPKTHLKKCIEYHTPTDLPINKGKKFDLKKNHEYTYYQNFAEKKKK